MSAEHSLAAPGAPAVYTRVPRPDAAVVQALSPFGVATVHEAYHRRGLMHGLSPLDPESWICGPAVTALIHAGDNLMVHAAIEQCQPGDVLVVATLSPSSHGIFGELLATLCTARGIAGLVNDAGVRDSQLIRRMGFPVWARTVSAAGSTKHTPGWVNVPVVCGGVLVRPGDLVVADADGVVIVKAEDGAEVARRAREREEREEAIRAAYRAGTPKDVRQLLLDGGVAFIDSTER
ncbi:MAG: 4-carboxy-4-hydroxy-2-oxoadipate aldolase/oxaloacetate decarboxylase [Micromonosporaceae bacterium]|nr:4-carboxy-4-hydroxy-2-oxoadipate aldolase/oxaloacetate decarboxylase [Micromonosporaceae bacterium]